MSKSNKMMNLTEEHSEWIFKQSKPPDYIVLVYSGKSNKTWKVFGLFTEKEYEEKGYKDIDELKNDIYWRHPSALIFKVYQVNHPENLENPTPKG